MKNSLSGITLVNGERRKNQKFGGDPKFTNAFLNSIESENKEGKIPPAGDFVIFRYQDLYHHINSKYTINREGEIKSLKGKVMKPFFYKDKKGQRVRIQVVKQDKEGKAIPMEKEIRVLQMMETVFGQYFPGYKLKQKDPKNYILVPKDGDYNNMRYDNLCYEHKDENPSSKKRMIKNCFILDRNVDVKHVSTLCHATESYVKKVKMELISMGKLPEFGAYQNFQKEVGIEFSEDSLKIYQALIQSQGKLSNLEIAKLLRPEEVNSENQKIFTNKVSRVRKRLTDRGIIPRFNERFESKREKALEMIKNKAKTHMTNQHIADTLGLKKYQIDNIARDINKKS